MNKKEVIKKFVDAICELSKANRLTGIWDNRRFQECKKDLKDVDLTYVYKTEKLSRKNVELRAIHRTNIDISMKYLIDSLND